MKLDLFVGVVGALIAFTVAGLMIEARDYAPGLAWLLAGGVWTGVAFDVIRYGRN